MITSPLDPDQLTLFEKLELYPGFLTEEQLLWLMERYEGCNPQGKNAQIPVKAFLILEARLNEETT